MTCPDDEHILYKILIGWHVLLIEYTMRSMLYDISITKIIYNYNWMTCQGHGSWKQMLSDHFSLSADWSKEEDVHLTMCTRVQLKTSSELNCEYDLICLLS